MTIKTFVLIYSLSPIYGGGIATDKVEFASLSECEKAADLMKERYSGTIRFAHVCVEKTTIPVAR